MSDIKVMPVVLVQKFLSGALVNGVKPAGSAMVDSGESISRGRYREFSDLTSGGLVSILGEYASEGYRVVNCIATLPGVTAISLNIIDHNGDSFSVGHPVVTAGDFYLEFRNGGLLIAPDCAFQVKGTGALSAVGRLMVILGQGWGATPFDRMPILGKINTVMDMQRSSLD